MILFLAGLQGVPEELYEASQIDGASWWQTQRKITLPLLGPTIRTWAFLSMIGSLQLFDMVWILTQGGPANATTTMATFLITEGTKRQNYGIAAAASVILFIVALVLALLYQRFILRRDIQDPRIPEEGEGMSAGTLAPTAATSPKSPRTRGARRRTGKYTGGNPLVYALALAVVALTVGPVLYGVLGGFRTNAQLAESPAGMPDPWVLFNYTGVLTNPNFWRYALNSTVIALLTTALVVVFGIMAAYPLARYKFKGREQLFTVFVLGLLFPATVAIIPLFILITDLGMGNTWWGVALPQAAFALPVTVVILRPFLQALPDELEEAALLDGASRIGFFWRILLPLSGPGMVTVGVLAFVGSWNAYLLPLLLLQSDMKTLPLGVADFSSEYSSDTAGVFAFTSLAMIPALVFFLAMQKRIVNGLQGAVKG